MRFKLDQETSNPTDVGMYQLRESNALVEEFMLLANITVAKKVLRHFPTLALLRRHQPPSKEQFSSLVSAASAVGVHIDISTSKVLSIDHFPFVKALSPRCRRWRTLWMRQSGPRIPTSTSCCASCRLAA